MFLFFFGTHMNDIDAYDYCKFFLFFELASYGRLFDFIPASEQKLNLSSSKVASSPQSSRQSAFAQSVSHNLKKAVPNSLFNVKVEEGVEDDKVVTEYTWVPTADRILAEKYFEALPKDELPIAGTQGAVDRRRKLQYQLPYHDTDVMAAKSITSDADREQHTRFLTTLKEKVVGVGQLIEWNDEKNLHSASVSFGAPAEHIEAQSANTADAVENLPQYGVIFSCFFIYVLLCIGKCYYGCKK
ncbi:unnamed protein product [Toxocara canis]|uniref:PET domain-containing protein n=1 Tax=Toxocara canis TaxID=6265 RepID=A0A183VG35_TOXCA|nr:unnamed protein product [Toxocara canis]